MGLAARPARRDTRAMKALALLAAALLSGCVFVPRTQTTYDAQCSVHRRQMTLDAAQLGNFNGCSGRECGYVLAAIGAIAAASLVVSGSIVVAGNMVYYLEARGRCST
jgi:hypothetical protein